MANAVFIYNPNTQDVQERDDKIIADPVELGVARILIDGKWTDIVATSGTLQYSYVEPGDFPEDEQERQARTGSVRAK